MRTVNPLVWLRNQESSLKGCSQKIARTLLINPLEFTQIDLKEFAAKAGVAQSSVVRFYQNLGYSNYSQLKINVARNLSSNDFTGNILSQKWNNMEITVRNTATLATQAIEESLQTLDYQVLEQAVNAMMKAPRIEFYGIGTSSILAQDSYYRLMRIGYPCYACVDSHIMRTSAANLPKGSVAFGISYTGRSKDTIRALELAKERQAITVCLTAFADSPICAVSDYTLLCISNEIKMSGESYSNTVAQKIILDSIYNYLAEKKLTPHRLEKLYHILDETRF